MKGILMTPDNAQKCFDGDKTQTRRLIKPQPARSIYEICNTTPEGWQTIGHSGRWTTEGDDGADGNYWKCPYSVGEHVYIKETWALLIPVGASIHAERIPHYKGNGDQSPRWKPSLFMPERYARTIVEITDIREQRVQDISEDDAIAEGVQGDETYDQSTPRMCFEALWDSIHGEGAWERNDFVWVPSFKRVNLIKNIGGNDVRRTG